MDTSDTNLMKKKSRTKSPSPVSLRNANGTTWELMLGDAPAYSWFSRSDEADGSAESDEDESVADRKGASGPWARPSGKARAEYDGYRKWKTRRWMWEFLRRNVEYQALAQLSPVARSLVIDQFFMTAYKHHTQEFDEGHKPSFAVGIRSYPKRRDFVESNLMLAKAAERSSSSFGLPKVVAPEEVLISFNIAPMIFNLEGSLNLQLARAEGRLRSFAAILRKIYANDAGVAPVARPKTYDPLDLVDFLRCLDLRHSSSLSNLDVISTIYSDRKQDLVRPDKKASDMFAKATGLVMGGFAGLVLQQDKLAARQKSKP